MTNNQTQNYLLWNEVLANPQSLDNETDTLRYLANVGALAVSTHNTQPWLVKLAQKSILVYPDFSKKLPFGDPLNRGLYISLGAYVQTVVLAAKALGLQNKILTQKTHWEIHFEDLRVTQKPEELLLAAISQRFSNKSYYLEKMVPKKSLEALSKQAEHFSVNLVSNAKPSVLEYLSKEYVKAAGEMAKEERFRKELASWLRPNRTAKKDGMPGFTAGVPLLLSYLGPYVLPIFPQAAKVQVMKDAGKLQRGPVVGVIFAFSNSKTDWFETGRLYTQTAISATQMKLHVTPMAAFIENPPYQEKLINVFNLPSKSRPQMFFRLGYSDTSVVHTPRRHVV